jgi:hypothetical protein
LLGQSFLSRLKSWSIDNQRQILVFNEPPTRAIPEDTPKEQPETLTKEREWKYIAKSSIGTETLVDVSSIRIIDGIRRAWFKQINRPHQFPVVINGVERWTATITTLREINCAIATRHDLAHQAMYDDGTNYVTPTDFVPTSWEEIMPGTMFDAEMKFLCAWKPT